MTVCLQVMEAAVANPSETAAVAGGVASHGSPCCDRVGVVALGSEKAQQCRGVGACGRLSLLSLFSV